MKTEIWLVRHGQTEWNRHRRVQGIEDIELNEVGLRQAEQVANYLKDEFFSVIASSPLKRAFETAATIQKRNKQQPPLVTDKDLVERNYGQMSGLTYEERAKLPKSADDYGVETLEALAQRAEGVLDRLEERYRGERLLVVSHGGLIKTLITSVNQTHDRSKIVIDNCSVSKLVHLKNSWAVVEQNIIEHLDGTFI